jgi:tetratricopeptide (TPR) repeat protein
VLQAQGRLKEALLEYQATRQIMLRLRQHYPDNADWQRDLAFAYYCVGSLWEGLGQPDRAVKDYEQSLTIAKKLVTLDPTSMLWQQDLIDFERRLEQVRR